MLDRSVKICREEQKLTMRAFKNGITRFGGGGAEVRASHHGQGPQLQVPVVNRELCSSSRRISSDDLKRSPDWCV